MRRIYLSPHLDDAVLSCGGLIWEQVRKGVRVEIWTLCAGEPPEGSLSVLAETLHAEWGTGLDTVARRREEDVSACRRIGALFRHLPTPDCIYRRAQDGNWLYENPDSIMGDIHPSEHALIATLHEFLRVILRPDDVLVCPLTVGGHVDHRLTRAVAEKLNQPLHYYADVPYVFEHRSDLERLTVGFNSEIHHVSDSGLTAWQDAIAAYESQIGMLFEHPRSMRLAMHDYWKDGRGIPLWQRIR